MKKKKKILISLVVGFCAVILIALSVVLFIEKVHILMDEPPIYNTEEEFVQSKDYIFIAKVQKVVKTKNNKEASIPLTFYNIEVIEYLKGEGDKSEVLCFYGGRNYLNTYTYYKNNDVMPQENSIYLFFVNKASGKSEYISATDFVISTNSQKIELKEYDESKSISNQNDDIVSIISKYENLI